jgi:hypothetical protein
VIENFDSIQKNNTNSNRHHYIPTVTAHPLARTMPPKRSKKSPDPNRISTRPKNAVTHPGQVVHTQCSTRRPDPIIQAEKAEKAGKRAKQEQQSIKQDESAEAIAEYENDMVTSDAIEDTQFPRHRDKGMSY